MRSGGTAQIAGMRETVAHFMRVLLGVAIPLAAFTTGLVAPKAAVAEPLWKQPGLLLRSLLVIFVLVPLWAFVLLKLVPLPPFVRQGVMIAILAVGIGPAATMKRMKGATPAVRFAFELNVAVLLLSIVLVPADVAGIGVLTHKQFHLDVAAVAKVVFGRALLPLALGVATARFLPRLAEPLGRYLPKIENVVFLLVIAVALAATWRNLLGVGAAGWLVCAVTALGALVVGHLLGGPEDGTRAGLATASTMRFPALALLLASSVAANDKRLVAVVLVYVLSALVVVGVYGALMARRAKRRGGAEAAPPPTPITSAVRPRAPAPSTSG